MQLESVVLHLAPTGDPGASLTAILPKLPFMQLEHLADTLALAGIAERHPQADDDERRLRLLTLKHGPELVRRAYGWSADT